MLKNSVKSKKIANYLRNNVSMCGTFLLKLLRIGKSYINKLDLSRLEKKSLACAEK